MASHSFATAGSGRGCSAIATDTTNPGRSSIPATPVSTVEDVRRALPPLLALLATERGLSTCAQEYWSVRHGAIRSFVGAPDDEMLFCGVAIGYANPEAPVNALRSERMPLDAWARFV